MINNTKLLTICLACIVWVSPIMAFDSGSTGIDGDFSPNSDINLSLPANGIFNFNTLNIPAGVTVSFTKNALNTPVTILVAGDAIIDGNIDLSGIDGGSFELIPPGSYQGGQAVPPNSNGSNGSGPGGGRGGIFDSATSIDCGGSGAGHLTNGISNYIFAICINIMSPGLTYGSVALQPLLGGSGGGSGANASVSSLAGASGGSGGGALLLAVSGALTFNGAIFSVGGAGETLTSSRPESNKLSAGGGGSGGAIRLVSTLFTGQGSINVSGGKGGLSNVSGHTLSFGTDGSAGRIRIETESFQFTGSAIPGQAFTSSTAPATLFFANTPTIRITSIGGQNVPQFPTGKNDLLFPKNTTNPINIDISTSQVLVGEIVQVTLTPQVGNVVSVDSSPLSGTINSATTSANINLTPGASTITASVSFSVTTAQSASLSRFTHGEPVKQLALSTTPSGGSTMTLITASGKSYILPQNIPMMN